MREEDKAMQGVQRGRSGLFFFTGGCRSGKSRHALNLAVSLPGAKWFVATAEARDAEMRARVEKHREERRSLDGFAQWHTLEVSVAKAPELPELLLGTLPAGAVLLLDCLSTWAAACQEALTAPGGRLARQPLEAEAEIACVFKRFLEAARVQNWTSVLVSAEVGLGLVPDNPESRLFRDILGQVNQLAAMAAEEAYFCVSGLLLPLKNSGISLS